MAHCLDYDVAAGGKTQWGLGYRCGETLSWVCSHVQTKFDTQRPHCPRPGGFAGDPQLSLLSDKTLYGAGPVPYVMLPTFAESIQHRASRKVRNGPLAFDLILLLVLTNKFDSIFKT